MADFSETEISPVQSFTTAKAGVVGPRPFLAEGLTNIFKGLGEIGDARTASANEKAISDFVIQQTTVAEGVEQGTISSREALTRMRSNFKNAVASNRGLTSELFAAQSSVIGTAGIGKIATVGNEEQARVNRVTDALIDSGAVSPTATPEEFDIAITNFQLFEAADVRFKEQMRTLELSTAADAQIDRKRTQVAQEWLRDSSPHKLDTFTTTINTIVNNVGGDGVTGAEALLQLDQAWNAINTEFAGQLTEAGGYGAGLVVPFKMLYETAQKQVSGEYSTSFATAEKDRILALQEYLLVLDPRIASVAAASNVIQGLPIDQIVGATSAMSEVLAKNSVIDGDPAIVYSNDPTQVKAVKDYYSSLTSVMRAGNMDKELQDEMVVHLSNIFGGTINGEVALSKNAVLGKDMVRFFSSQEFFTFLSENPEAKTEGYQEALSILQTNYADEVWGMARREFTEGDYISDKALEEAIRGVTLGTGAEGGEATTAERTPTTSTVAYRSTDSGMEFYAIDPDDATAKAEAKQLNKTLRPVLNETVRGFAHLNGRTDYGTYWNEVSETILGTKGLGDEALGQESFKQGALTIGEVSFDPPDLGPGIDANPTVAAGFLEGSGFSREQVAGIVGNLMVESGNNMDPTAIGDNGNAFGIAQWNGPRMRAFKQWAGANNKPEDSIETQLEYIVHELETTESRAAFELRKATTAEEAALAFSKWFERPGIPRNDRRVANANKVLSGWGGTQTGTYTSESEVQSAVDSGEVSIGDEVVVNGVRMRVEADG